jgi:hypothetical protein
VEGQRGPEDSASAPQSGETGDPAERAERFDLAWAPAEDEPLPPPELLPERLARACAAVLAVDGAGISLLDRGFRVPLGASDDLAGLAERLQFTQGEGPCLDAARQRRTLVAGAAEIQRRWPLFAEELFDKTPYRAILALPLAVTSAVRGAINLFLVDEQRVHDISLADASTVAERSGNALRDARAAGTAWVEAASGVPQPDWIESPAARDRTVVWLAMGMAMTRFELNAADALAMLQAYAYGNGTVVDEVAADVVEGRLDISALRP